MAINQFPIWKQLGANGQEPSYQRLFFIFDRAGRERRPGDLAAAASATQPLTFQSNSYFEAWKLTFFATLDGATQPNLDNIQVPVSVFISDTGSGKQLMNAPVPLSDIAGPGRLPFIVPGKRIFLPNSTVTFTFANFDSAQWDNILLTLHRRKSSTSRRGRAMSRTGGSETARLAFNDSALFR